MSTQKNIAVRIENILISRQSPLDSIVMLIKNKEGNITEVPFDQESFCDAYRAMTEFLDQFIHPEILDRLEELYSRRKGEKK